MTYNIFEAYSENLLALLCLYNSNHNNNNDNLNLWVDKLLAKPSYHSSQNSTENNNDTLHLNKYISIILNTLLADEFLIKAKYYQYPTSQVYSSLITQIILALLQELPSQYTTSLTTMNILNIHTSKSIFSIIPDDNDDTNDSRQSTNGLFPIIQFTKEWIQNSLISDIQSDYGIYKYIKLVEIIQLTQHPLLMETRLQVGYLFYYIHSLYLFYYI